MKEKLKQKIKIYRAHFSPNGRQGQRITEVLPGYSAQGVKNYIKEIYGVNATVIWTGKKLTDHYWIEKHNLKVTERISDECTRAPQTGVEAQFAHEGY